MTLKNFNQYEDIEKIEPSVSDAKSKLNKANKFLNFARKTKDIGDPEMIYTPIYDATRIACESLIALNGYRVKKSSTKHHFTVISVAKELMQGKNENEFSRIQKMRKKRNKLEYGNLEVISESELEQSFKDAKTLINKVEELIKDEEVQQPML